MWRGHLLARPRADFCSMLAVVCIILSLDNSPDFTKISLSWVAGTINTVELQYPEPRLNKFDFTQLALVCQLYDYQLAEVHFWINLVTVFLLTLKSTSSFQSGLVMFKGLFQDAQQPLLSREPQGSPSEDRQQPQSDRWRSRRGFRGMVCSSNSLKSSTAPCFKLAPVFCSNFWFTIIKLKVIFMVLS